MSYDEQPAVSKGLGISSATADAARNECLVIERDLEKPVTWKEHNTATRAASNEFLLGGQEEIARFLRIAPTDVRKRYGGSRAGNFNPLQYTLNPARTDIVNTILALGDLSYTNGLPALGSSKVTYTLKSGETLHFMGDLEQTYGEGGGGTLIWFVWSNLP